MKEVKKVTKIKKEMISMKIQRKFVGSGKTKSADLKQIANMIIQNSAKRC